MVWGNICCGIVKDPDCALGSCHLFHFRRGRNIKTSFAEHPYGLSNTTQVSKCPFASSCHHMFFVWALESRKSWDRVQEADAFAPCAQPSARTSQEVYKASCVCRIDPPVLVRGRPGPKGGFRGQESAGGTSERSSTSYLGAMRLKGSHTIGKVVRSDSACI